MTSSGRQIVTSTGSHIGMSPRWSIGSLGYVLGTLEGNVTGTSWVPIFADWVIIELKGDKIGGTFYKDSLQKTNQTEFRVYKVIKGKVTNYMSNGKATTVLLTVALMKKTSYK